jgi:hypothetical protein
VVIEPSLLRLVLAGALLPNVPDVLGHAGNRARRVAEG